MLWLSKSKYTLAWQCPKILWLRQYKPGEEAPLDSGTLARMNTGNDVGDLAMGLFGDFVEVTAYKDAGNGDRALDLGAMISRTKEEMEKGTPVICEASFGKDGNFCSVDILKQEAGGWAIYEVKSSTHPEKPEYAVDTAYQKYVLEKCGVNVTGTYIVTLDSSYVLDGELDISKLFKITDISEKVSEEIEKVGPKVEEVRKMAESDAEPDIACGTQCFTPHKCRFVGYCMRDLPSPSAFDLYRISKKKAFEYYYAGKADLRTLYESGELDDPKSAEAETRLRQAEHYVKSLPPHVDAEGIRSFADTVSYPLYFLDFETMTPVVPVYQGTKSRQQIPFQYSLHYIEEKGGELRHKEFLAESGPDPRRDLAESLCRDIPMGVCTMVYSKSMESGRIKELAEEFPDLAEHLLGIDKGIVDLIEPFRKGYYYNRNMTPSGDTALFSIKNVLPSVFPDDPELDYHNLEGVSNGGEAMEIFPQIQYMDPEERERTREGLLKYCELDTYAMVKLWQELERIV